MFAQPACHLQAVTVRHAYVENGKIGLVLAGQAYGLLTTGCFQYHITGTAQTFSQGGQHQAIVVGDQQGSSRFELPS